MKQILITLQEKENARLEKVKEQAEKQRLKQIEKEQKKNAEIEYELYKINYIIYFKL